MPVPGCLLKQKALKLPLLGRQLLMMCVHDSESTKGCTMSQRSRMESVTSVCTMRAWAVHDRMSCVVGRLLDDSLNVPWFPLSLCRAVRSVLQYVKFPTTEGAEWVARNPRRWFACPSPLFPRSPSGSVFLMSYKCVPAGEANRARHHHQPGHDGRILCHGLREGRRAPHVLRRPSAAVWHPQRWYGVVGGPPGLLL